jgi:hypothetical protein
MNKGSSGEEAGKRQLERERLDIRIEAVPA